MLSKKLIRCIYQSRLRWSLSTRGEAYRPKLLVSSTSRTQTWWQMEMTISISSSPGFGTWHYIGTKVKQGINLLTYRRLHITVVMSRLYETSTIVADWCLTLIELVLKLIRSRCPYGALANINPHLFRMWLLTSGVCTWVANTTYRCERRPRFLIALAARLNLIEVRRTFAN